MSQIEIVNQKHIVFFDDIGQITSVYFLKVSQSTPVENPQPEEDKPFSYPFISDDNPLQFQIWSENAYTWTFQSQYLVCKELKQSSQYGTMPFSLQTYLDMYKDVRLHKFVFQIKQGVQKDTLGSHDVIGKIILKTKFKSNPFVFPLQVKGSEAKKKISIVVPEDQIAICSGELLDTIEAEEVDGFESKKNYKYLRIFEYAVNSITDAKLICVLKGRFQTKRLLIQNVEVNLMHPQGYQVQNIQILRQIFSRLFAVMKPKSIIIIRGIQTRIECAEGIMFWSKNCLNLYERMFRTQLLSKIKDEWIIQGMCSYRNNNRHFHNKFNELCDLVKKGEEFSPLIDDQYSMDQIWKLKATVLYHIFTNLTHQQQKLTHVLLSSIKEDRKMTTQSFIRSIKNKYGIASLKPHEQFFKFTGITKLYYQFSYIKKQNKVKLRIRQKPIQSKIFQNYNTWRIRLEESYNVKSILIQKILEKNNISAKEENNKKKDNLQGPLLVPVILKSNSFVRGKIPISLAETNESEVRQQNYDIKIKKKKINKQTLNCRNKLRKTINKKGGIEKEMAASPSWMKLDPTQTYLFAYFNENVDNVKLLKQLIWENNEMQLLKILQYVKNQKQAKDTAIMDQLCKMLEIKETNRTSLSVRQQILSVFPTVLANSDDRKPWDCILSLLRLYEPTCYDRSIQGHHFKIAILESLSKLKIKKNFLSYFQQFHRIMLAMSKDSQVLFPGKQEIEYRKCLYRTMLSWRTKHTLQIINEIYEVTLVYLFRQQNFAILKVIVEKIFGISSIIDDSQNQLQKLTQLKTILREAMKYDSTHSLWLIQFANTMTKAQSEKSPIEFFIFMYYQLEQTRVQKPQIYQQALKTIKNILSKNKKKYAFDLQLNVFNPNQNYFIAQRLWEKLTTGESLYVPGVRLQWMKIYRVFYFYFTPVSVIYKIKYDKEDDPFALPLSSADRQQILANIKDFTPDTEWFSGYDITNKKSESLKEQDKQQIDRLKQKRIKQRTEVNLQSTKFIARRIKQNPEKEVNWVQLCKYMLDHIIGKHENKRTKMEIINNLKSVKKKLKRGNMPTGYSFQKLQKQCLDILEAGEQQTDTLKQLIDQIKQVLQKVIVRQSDTSFILPKDVLKM